MNRRIEEIKKAYKRPKNDEQGWDYVDFDDVEYLLRIAECAEELIKSSINFLEFGIVCDCEEVKEGTCEWCKRAMRLERYVRKAERALEGGEE